MSLDILMGQVYFSLYGVDNIDIPLKILRAY